MEFPGANPEARRLLNELQRISDILLIRLRSLGDAILTLPLIETLHQWRPDLRQSVLIEAPFAAVFEHHPAVHEILILRRSEPDHQTGLTRLQAVRALRKRRYPAVLNLHGGTTSMFFTLATGARLRIGQEGHRGSWIYTECIPSSGTVWNRQKLHTVEHQLTLPRWLNIPVSAGSSSLYVNETARTNVTRRLTESRISQFILIHPTATLPTKQWAPTNFSVLADRLFEEHRLPVIFTASSAEKRLLDQIGGAAGKRHIYWSDLPLVELFALIEKCRLFVGCDSGPAHAASVLKRPVVVVWGSSNFDAWHPWGTEYEVVKSNLPCMPCPGYRCEAFGNPRCILDIPVLRVAEACSRILDRTY